MKTQLTPAQIEMDRQNSESWDRVYFAHLKHAERLNAVSLLEAVGQLVRRPKPPTPIPVWVFDDQADALQSLQEAREEREMHRLDQQEFDALMVDMEATLGRGGSDE